MVQVHPGPPFKSPVNKRVFAVLLFTGISLKKPFCQLFVNFPFGWMRLHSGRSEATGYSPGVANADPTHSGADHPARSRVLEGTERAILRPGPDRQKIKCRGYRSVEKNSRRASKYATPAIASGTRKKGPAVPPGLREQTISATDIVMPSLHSLRTGVRISSLAPLSRLPNFFRSCQQPLSCLWRLTGAAL